MAPYSMWYVVLFVNITLELIGDTRGVQKVLQLSMMHKWHKQNFYVIIQHNHP